MTLQAHNARRPVAMIRHRVQPVEVDGFQVVHFSNYLRWYSGAMMAAFEASGFGPGRFGDGRIEIRVGRVQAAYIASARLGDEVTVEVIDLTLTRNGLLVVMRATSEGRLLSRARIAVAFVEADTGRLAAPPADVIAALGTTGLRSTAAHLPQPTSSGDAPWPAASRP